jgi:hypothetical protein
MEQDAILSMKIIFKLTNNKNGIKFILIIDKLFYNVKI